MSGVPVAHCPHAATGIGRRGGEHRDQEECELVGAAPAVRGDVQPALDEFHGVLLIGPPQTRAILTAATPEVKRPRARRRFQIDLLGDALAQAYTRAFAVEGSEARIAADPAAVAGDAVEAPHRIGVGAYLGRWVAFARAHVPPVGRRRLAVAVAGYAVLVLFALSLWLARGVGGWSWSVAVAVGVVVSVPLALAFVYDRLAALKTPWFEIALTAATVEVAGALATALEEQMLNASASPALTEAISAVLAPGAPKVVRVNLRTGPYWWSTRVYLLAALADDFTGVERFAFVEGGAARRYVGLASPRATRTVLAARFPEYARAYASLRANSADEPRWAVQTIVGNWQSALWEQTKPAGATAPGDPAVHEELVKAYVTAAELNEWLSGVLDTGWVAWDGWPQDPRLRATILAQDEDYVAVVHDGRLDRVVSRDALALAVARSALRLG